MILILEYTDAKLVAPKRMQPLNVPVIVFIQLDKTGFQQ